MATLPDFTALQKAAPQPSLGTAEYQPPNWRQVGAAGQIVADSGRTLDQAGEVMAQANQRQDEIVAQSAGNTMSSSRARLQFDPEMGFANVHEQNALGPQFVDGYLQRYDTAAAAVRGNLQSPNQQRLFDAHTAMQRNAFQQALLEHQSRETDKFNDTTDTATIQNGLTEIAQRPTDDLTFQRNLVGINSTISSMAQRKGMSTAAVGQLQQKYLDAAYGSRITALLDGIPGVVQADPYAAEAMFKQAQPVMGEGQIQLGKQVQQAVKGVQQRDLAHSLIYGNNLVDPKDMLPGAPGAPLAGIVKTLETGGLAKPDQAVSPKGALGSMQVMPATADNPGYGIDPAKKGPDGKYLPGELDRVGNQFLGAMTARYQDPALILAAYNAGPGTVDKWIAQHGDPRLGEISDADWAGKLPFQETKDYVSRGLAKVGSLPTASQVKAERLPQLLQQAHDTAMRMYPNDPAFADGVVARTSNYFNVLFQQKTAQQQAASSTLAQSLLGPSGTGKDAPQTIDQALADPSTKAAYEQATPEVKGAYLTRLAQGDKQLTADGMKLWYSLNGRASSDPEGFLKEDLSKYFGQMPDHLLQQLVLQQSSINKKDVAQANKQLNWEHATADVEDIVKPLGLGKSAKANTAQSKTTEMFYGQFQEALQQQHDRDGKWPDSITTRKIAAGLVAQGAISGGMLWDTKEPFFQARSEGNQGKFYVPLPAARSAQYSALVQKFTQTMGRKPNDAELQAAYTRYRLAGGAE